MSEQAELVRTVYFSVEEFQWLAASCLTCMSWGLLLVLMFTLTCLAHASDLLDCL